MKLLNFLMLGMGSVAIYASGQQGEVAPPKAIAVEEDDVLKPSSQDGAEISFLTAKNLYEGAINKTNDLLPVQREEMLRTAAIKYWDFVQQMPEDKRIPEALYNMGLIAGELGDRIHQQSYFERLIKDHPKGDYAGLAGYRLGLLALERQQWQEAVGAFHKAIAEAVNLGVKADSRYRQGFAYYRLGQKNNALEPLLGVGKDPDTKNIPTNIRAAALILAGYIYRDLKQWDAASACFKDVTNLAVEKKIKLQALFYLADAQDKLGKNAEALKTYDQLLMLSAGENNEWASRAKLILAQDYNKREKYSDAVKTLEGLTLRNLPVEDQVRAKILLGRGYFNLKKYDLAMLHFGEAERLGVKGEEAFQCAFSRLVCSSRLKDRRDLPDRIQAFFDVYGKSHRNHAFVQQAFLLAAEFYAENGRKKDSIEMYQQINPLLLPENIRIEVLYKKASAMAEARNRTDAIKAYTEFIAQAPKNDPRLPVAYVQRGRVYLGMQKEGFAHAMNDFDEVVKRWPKSPAAAAALESAAKEYTRNGQTKEATAKFELLIKNFPNLEPKVLAELRYLCGKGYYDLKEFKKAIVHLEESRTLLPEKYNERSGLLLVISYYQDKDYENVRKSVDRLLKDVPNLRKNQIPDAVTIYIGRKCYADKDYKGADKYLTLATDPAQIERSGAIVWQQLASARYELKQYQKALEAIDICLKLEKNDSRLVMVKIDKIRILNRLNKFDQARALYDDVAKVQIEGPVAGTLKYEGGCIEYGQKRYKEATTLFVTVAEFFADQGGIQGIKPKALYMAAKSYEAAGNKAEAEKYRNQLRQEFSDWKPEEE